MHYLLQYNFSSNDVAEYTIKYYMVNMRQQKNSLKKNYTMNHTTIKFMSPGQN